MSSCWWARCCVRLLSFLDSGCAVGVGERFAWLLRPKPARGDVGEGEYAMAVGTVRVATALSVVAEDEACS